MIRFIVLCFIICVNLNLFAQCDEKGISTNPEDPQNTEKSSAQNTFYWFPSQSDKNSTFNLWRGVSGSGSITKFNNPFWQNSNSVLGRTLASLRASDFYPQDGWELIKADFGFLADGVTNTTTVPSMPYFCLYNRYRGLMRFFGAIPGTTSYQTVEWTIALREFKFGGDSRIEPMDKLAATNLLSPSGKVMQPLDQSTNAKEVTVLTEYPGAEPDGHMFWFDIPVAYDPCVCKNNSAIQLSGKLIKRGSFEAEGNMVGTIQKLSVGAPGSKYPSLLGKRILGAAGALAVGAATKGQVVQTGKFMDLLDLIISSPNSKPASKKDAKFFNAFFTATNDFVRDGDKWKQISTGDKMSNDELVKLIGGINTYLNANFDLAKPSSSGTKDVTTVNGRISLTGQYLEVQEIQTKPYWAIPGSKFSTDLKEEEEDASQITGSVNPEYPIYNELLGTFALIKTPDIKYKANVTTAMDKDEFILIDDPMCPSCPQIKQFKVFDAVKFEAYLPEDLKYTINPKLHTNFDKTKIKAMLVFDFEELDHEKWAIVNEHSVPAEMITLESARKAFNPYNVSENYVNNQFISYPVDLDDLRELYVGATIRSTNFNFAIPPSFRPKVYLRLFMEFQSEDLGRNNLPVKNKQLFTYPTNLLDMNDLDVPPNKFNIYNDDDLVIGNIFNPSINYSSDSIIYTGGKISIISNLSTDPGVTVRIFSLTQINIGPDVEISPNIELIIGSPFLGLFPQNPVSGQFVENFCNGNTTIQYQANVFSQPKKADLTQTQDTTLENTLPNVLISVFPNPNLGTFNLTFSKRLEAAGIITIFDLSGKLVYSQAFQNGSDKYKILSNGLAIGIYIATIEVNGDRFCEKIMIQRNH